MWKILGAGLEIFQTLVPVLTGSKYIPSSDLIILKQVWDCSNIGALDLPHISYEIFITQILETKLQSNIMQITCIKMEQVVEKR